MKKLFSTRCLIVFCGILMAAAPAAFRLQAIEIPLDQLQPVRIGYVDLQKVFDTYPEKSFAEGDLLREIEKRKRDLNRRQTEIAGLRAQVASDEAAMAEARLGHDTTVPPDSMPEAEVPGAPAASTTTVHTSTTTAIEPYPTEDPLAGLPGHENAAARLLNQNSSAAALPGVKDTKKGSLLDNLAAANAPVPLTDDAKSALQRRIDNNKRRLDRAVMDFRRFRSNALGDMKQLQTEKTYGVMARIYAVLQTLARDENISVVLDKAYVLYGEDTVDLSDKLISRLGQEAQ